MHRSLARRLSFRALTSLGAAACLFSLAGACFPDAPVPAVGSTAQGGAAGVGESPAGRGGASAGETSAGGASAGGSAAEAGRGGAAGGAGASVGGAAGDTAAGGEAGAGAGSVGGGGGAAGAVASGGEAGAGGGEVGGAGAGTGGAAGTSPLPLATKPASLDCDTPPIMGMHRFCTDFAPLPPGWAGAGCSVTPAEDGNVYWRFEQNKGSTCQSFVNVVLGTPVAKLDLALWVRIDALGFADPELEILTARVGPSDDVTGAIVLRPRLDGVGVVSGYDYFVGQSRDATKRALIAPALLGEWQHIRLSAAVTGALTGSVSASTAAPASGVASLMVPGVPSGADSKIELSFRQSQAGTAPTRVSLDELVVDVTAP